MWDIAEAGDQKKHGRYVHSLMKRDVEKYLRVANHMKSLKALLGEDGTMATIDGIANVDFNNGLIRFPCMIKSSTESMVIDKVYQQMERKTMPNGFYSVSPENLRFEERFIEDINRYHPMMSKPNLEKGQIAFCCELDKQVIESLVGLAKHAEKNKGPVMFASTRAYFNTHTVQHNFNLGKTAGFQGETFFHVLKHMQYSICDTWRIFRTREKHKKKGCQYVFVNSFSTDPWSDCVVLYADV